MLSKVKKRLVKWKGKHISLVGRVTLISYVLSVIPLYYLSLFKMSIFVSKEINRIQRDFLWGLGHQGRKIAWVSWDINFNPKKDGGLGIKDLLLFNKALLGKWV